MIAFHEGHDIVWAAALTAASSIIVGVLLLLGVIYQARKTRGKLDTGNDREIGVTVHDLAMQSATNTRELLDVAGKLDTHLEESAQHSAELRRVGDALSAHIEEVQPVVAWTKAQMEEGP